jgi:hypothetical protein
VLDGDGQAHRGTAASPVCYGAQMQKDVKAGGSSVRRIRSLAALTIMLAGGLAAAACGGDPLVAPGPGGDCLPKAGGEPQPGSTQDSGAPHVMVIVMENRDYESVIGSADAPCINRLANTYGLATQSFGTTHPSLPNYLELIAGRTFGITDDCTDCSVEGTTVVDQLGAAGVGWRAYMEGVSTPCFTGASTDTGYAKKHDPFLYLRHLREDPASCGRVVPFDRLAADLTAGTAPPFTFVVPSLCHDGHDCSTRTADSWVAATMPVILTSAWYREGGRIIVTWDEGEGNAGCCRGAAGGRVPTLVLSTRVSGPARSSSPVDQAGILRTIETLYGLSYLGDAGCACSGDLLALTGR